MSEPDTPSGLRIGDAERNAAMSALDAHLQAGRLDAIEYGERSARAATARTVDELRPLFSDLPQPHPPQLDGPAATAAPLARTDTAAPTGTASTAVAPARSSGSGALARWGPRVSGAMPLLALVLFFTVPIPQAWVFFLLIPLAGVLFAGTRGDDAEHDRN